MTPEKTFAMSKRVRGLDGLRFGLALCVVVGHIGLPISVDPSSYSLPWNYITAVYANAFNGPAAVVCFFLISGFCIHFPYRYKSIDFVSYFARRHIRIWIPIFTALLLAKSLGYRTSLLGESILWSLIAEEIYYLLYPWLLGLSRQFGWCRLLLVSAILAFALVLANPSAQDYPSFSFYGNWILGLPVWISGCLLANQYDQLKNHAPAILLWRFGLLATFVLTSIARFHFGLGYPWSLSLAAIYFWFWLRAEILHYKTNEPFLLLENLGKLTYSLYLTHLVFFHVLKLIVGDLPSNVFWRLSYLILIVVAAAIFYAVIESPSHRLARMLGKRLAKGETHQTAFARE